MEDFVDLWLRDLIFMPNSKLTIFTNLSKLLKNLSSLMYSPHKNYLKQISIYKYRQQYTPKY